MGKDFTSALRPAIVMTFLFAVLLGLAYPMAMTGVGQAIFPNQANGSLVTDHSGKVIGSEVVGQAFVADRYFQTRPSAAGKGYDGLASSGSNLGPAAQGLVDRVKSDVAKRHAEGLTGSVPADLVTASGSGLDPDISPSAALAQAPRIARVRGIGVERVRAMITAHVQGSILGDDHVNVLSLNRALDALPRAGTAATRPR